MEAEAGGKINVRASVDPRSGDTPGIPSSFMANPFPSCNLPR
jgi:hypothetical protein